MDPILADGQIWMLDFCFSAIIAVASIGILDIGFLFFVGSELPGYWIGFSKGINLVYPDIGFWFGFLDIERTVLVFLGLLMFESVSLINNTKMRRILLPGKSSIAHFLG